MASTEELFATTDFLQPLLEEEGSKKSSELFRNTNSMLRNGCNSIVPLLVSVLWTASISAANDGSNVTITGGADVSGKNYTWTIINDSGSSIVFVELAHYGGSMFFAPPGWSSKSTFLVNVGVKDRPGVCRAWVDSGVEGIRPGSSAEFRLKIGGRGVVRGVGRVIVRSSDGSETIVRNVGLPVPEPLSDTYVSLVGLTAVLLLAVFIQHRRTRKRGATVREAD